MTQQLLRWYFSNETNLSSLFSFSLVFSVSRKTVNTCIIVTCIIDFLIVNKSLQNRYIHGAYAKASFMNALHICL